MIRIRIKGIRRGIGRRDETGQHPRVPDLVRDPHIRGTAGEYAGAAANLRVVLATHIVVEA